MMETLNTFAAALAALGAVAAVVAAAWTVKEARLSREAASRPFVTVRYWNSNDPEHLRRTSNTERWFLVVENHGATPAHDVVITPGAKTTKWHHIMTEQATSLAFIAQLGSSELNGKRGLSILAPGQKIFYPIGDESFRDAMSDEYNVADITHLPPLEFKVAHRNPECRWGLNPPASSSDLAM